MDGLKFIPIDQGGASCPVCGRRVQSVERPSDIHILGSCAHYVGTGYADGQRAIVFRTEKSHEVTRDPKPR